MALVTVQRSPTPTGSSPEEEDESDLSTVDGTPDSQKSLSRNRSGSECYFAVKGAAIALPQNAGDVGKRTQSKTGAEIQAHLEEMNKFLRPEDHLKAVGRLESLSPNKIRYLAVVETPGIQDGHEAAILGFDIYSSHAYLGLVLEIFSTTRVALHGDGAISVATELSPYVFKPISVQVMWSLFQSLVCEQRYAAIKSTPYFPRGLTHTWIPFFKKHLDVCPEVYVNEWHVTHSDEEEVKAEHLDMYQEDPRMKVIRSALTNIMNTVDLSEVTTKELRTRLQEAVDFDVTEFRTKIEHEIFRILCQLDKPSLILPPFLYLGTEWNASNLEELQRNSVSNILNVTVEVDNFFPSRFSYRKIPVKDYEHVELQSYWNQDTWDFISSAEQAGKAVLVHCKRGISRSSATVIAYVMRSRELSLDDAISLVQRERSVIRPNPGFMNQLRTYEGMLNASRHRKNVGIAGVMSKSYCSMVAEKRLFGKMGYGKQETGMSQSSSARSVDLPMQPELFSEIIPGEDNAEEEDFSGNRSPGQELNPWPLESQQSDAKVPAKACGRVAMRSSLCPSLNDVEITLATQDNPVRRPLNVERQPSASLTKHEGCSNEAAEAESGDNEVAAGLGTSFGVDGGLKSVEGGSTGGKVLIQREDGTFMVSIPEGFELPFVAGSVDTEEPDTAAGGEDRPSEIAPIRRPSMRPHFDKVMRRCKGDTDTKSLQDIQNLLQSGSSGSQGGSGGSDPSLSSSGDSYSLGSSYAGSSGSSGDEYEGPAASGSHTTTGSPVKPGRNKERGNRRHKELPKRTRRNSHGSSGDSGVLDVSSVQLSGSPNQNANPTVSSSHVEIGSELSKSTKMQRPQKLCVMSPTTTMEFVLPPHPNSQNPLGIVRQQPQFPLFCQREQSRPSGSIEIPQRQRTKFESSQGDKLSCQLKSIFSKRCSVGDPILDLKQHSEQTTAMSIVESKQKILAASCELKMLSTKKGSFSSLDDHCGTIGIVPRPEIHVPEGQVKRLSERFKSPCVESSTGGTVGDGGEAPHLCTLDDDWLAQPQSTGSQSARHSDNSGPKHRRLLKFDQKSRSIDDVAVTHAQNSCRSSANPMFSQKGGSAADFNGRPDRPVKPSGSVALFWDRIRFGRKDSSNGSSPDISGIEHGGVGQDRKLENSPPPSIARQPRSANPARASFPPPYRSGSSASNHEFLPIWPTNSPSTPGRGLVIRKLPHKLSWYSEVCRRGRKASSAASCDPEVSTKKEIATFSESSTSGKRDKLSEKNLKSVGIPSDGSETSFAGESTINDCSTGTTTTGSGIQVGNSRFFRNNAVISKEGDTKPLITTSSTKSIPIPTVPNSSSPQSSHRNGGEIASSFSPTNCCLTSPASFGQISTSFGSWRSLRDTEVHPGTALRGPASRKAGTNVSCGRTASFSEGVLGRTSLGLSGPGSARIGVPLEEISLERGTVQRIKQDLEHYTKRGAAHEFCLSGGNNETKNGKNCRNSDNDSCNNNYCCDRKDGNGKRRGRRKDINFLNYHSQMAEEALLSKQGDIEDALVNLVDKSSPISATNVLKWSADKILPVTSVLETTVESEHSGTQSTHDIGLTIAPGVSGADTSSPRLGSTSVTDSGCSRTVLVDSFSGAPRLFSTSGFVSNCSNLCLPVTPAKRLPNKVRSLVGVFECSGACDPPAMSASAEGAQLLSKIGCCSSEEDMKSPLATLDDRSDADDDSAGKLGGEGAVTFHLEDSGESGAVGVEDGDSVKNAGEEGPHDGTTLQFSGAAVAADSDLNLNRNPADTYGRVNPFVSSVYIGEKVGAISLEKGSATDPLERRPEEQVCRNFPHSDLLPNSVIRCRIEAHSSSCGSLHGISSSRTAARDFGHSLAFGRPHRSRVCSFGGCEIQQDRQRGFADNLLPTVRGAVSANNLKNCC